MRTPACLLSIPFVITCNAQVDINKMIQERMQQQGQTGQPSGTPRGTQMVDDTDPFVPNEFIGSFRMEMRQYEGEVEQKNSPTNLYYWSSADMTLMRNDAAERDGQEMKILTDLKGKWTYTMMTDKKGKKTAMKTRKKKVVMAEETTGKKEPVITITKETKAIEGHTCTKVIVVSEDGTWTGWVAKDVKAPFADMARSAKQSGDEAQRRAMEKVDGMPLEFEWVKTDGNNRMVCYIRDLANGKVDAGVFSLEGYEVMEMPSFGR